MRFRPITWFLLSILFLIAACLFWRLGEERRVPVAPATKEKTTSPDKLSKKSVTSNQVKLKSVIFPNNLVVSGTPTNLTSAKKESDFQLSNTSQSLDELARKESVILLRNALIDTAASAP